MSTNNDSGARAALSPPQELVERAQWVVHRAKVPHDPRTGRRASTRDPATWRSFSEAAAALAGPGGWDGVGFVFTADDPFVGVDLDHCTDPKTGELDEWARQLVASLDSYTEWSPSGEGLHIFVRGELARALQVRIPGAAHERAGLEVYDRARYFTCTGHHFANSPRHIAPRGEALEELRRAHAPDPPHQGGGAPPPDESGEALDSPELAAALAAALEHLVPESNEAWEPVAMALHHAFDGDEAGWRVLDDWSASDSSYSRRIRRKNRARWRSFGRRGGRVRGAGTIFYLAREAGWTGSPPGGWARWAATSAPVERTYPHPTRRYDEDAEVLELDEARERIGELVRGALEWCGVHVLAVTPGVGKTRATLRELARWMSERPEGRVVWVTPTHVTEAEALERLRGEFDELGEATWVGSELDRLLRAAPVRTASSCLEFEKLNEVRHAYPDAAQDHCGSCWRNPHNGARGEHVCPFWRARRQQGARLEVMTHARAVLAAASGELAGDVVVWDECPLGALRREVRADCRALVWAAGVLGWQREEYGALLELLTPSSPRQACALRDALEGVALPDDVEQRVTEELAQVREQGRQARRRGGWEEWCASRPAFDVLLALVCAARGGWREARIEGGELVMSLDGELDADANCTIVLDATMTRPIAEVLWPDLDVFAAVRVEFPAHAEVIWVKTDLTTRDVRGGAWRRERRARLWHAVHGLYGAPGALHVTHKRYGAGDGASAQAWRALEDDGERVIYYLGAEGIGWDGACEAPVGIFDTFYPPRAAIEGLAQWFMGCFGCPDDPEMEAHWREQALHHLRARVIIQTIHRVRPVLADAQRPVRLVIAMQDDPTPYGFAPTEVVSEADLLWRAWGIAEVHDEPLACALLRAACAVRGGVWAPTRDPIHFDELREAGGLAGVSSALVDLGQEEWAEMLERALEADVGASLRGALRALGVDWSELARRADVSMALGYTGEAGHPVPIFHTADSVASLASAAPAWCRELGPPDGGDGRIPCWSPQALDGLWSHLSLVRPDGSPAPYSEVLAAIARSPVALFASFPKARRLLQALGGIEAVRQRWAAARGQEWEQLVRSSQPPTPAPRASLPAPAPQRARRRARRRRGAVGCATALLAGAVVRQAGTRALRTSNLCRAVDGTHPTYEQSQIVRHKPRPPPYRPP